MTHKEIIGNELYVYMNGSLLYKRWLNYGYGMMIASVKPGLDKAQGCYTAKDTQLFHKLNTKT